MCCGQDPRGSKLNQVPPAAPSAGAKISGERSGSPLCLPIHEPWATLTRAHARIDWIGHVVLVNHRSLSVRYAFVINQEVMSCLFVGFCLFTCITIDLHTRYISHIHVHMHSIELQSAKCNLQNAICKSFTNSSQIAFCVALQSLAPCQSIDLHH